MEMIRKNTTGKMRKRTFGTAMGITSIIAILIILVLIVFAVLSLITSRADLNLSEKTADNINAYYTADNSAEVITADFGNLVASGMDSIDPQSLSKESSDFAKGSDYEYDASTNTLKFTIAIDDARNLKIVVQYNMDGKVKEKKLWKVEPSKEWIPDDSIELFEP